MNLTESCQVDIPIKKRKRVGRGQGCKNGKTCGRGLKGASSRSGSERYWSFNGGCLPFFRRVPRKG